jgi:hypothetical protein
MRPPRNQTSSLRTGACVHHRVLAAGTVVLAAVTTFLLLPALASIPQRLASGCGRWLALGALFELMSAAGYVVAFRLSFGEGNRWSASWRTGVRVLAATTALPAGAVLGPALGGAAVLVYRALSLSVPLALGAGACVRRRPLAARAMKRPGAVDRASRRRAPRPARAR